MENNDSLFWGWFVDVATVIAAAMLYLKTSEVMTAIAPLTLLGQTGLQVIYGMTTAGLIEGVTLALHFVRRFRSNPNATMYKWFLFVVSGFCQFLDKQMVVDAGVSQSPVGSFFAWIALGIPLAVFGGLLWVANSTKTETSGNARKAFKGLVPMWNDFFYGNGFVAKSPDSVFASETEQVELEEQEKLEEKPEEPAKKERKVRHE